MQRLICVLCVFLLFTTGTAFAQEAEVEAVWYWGIDADLAVLVAYNMSGNINPLEVYLDPLDPQATVLRTGSDSAVVLVEIAGQLLVYEVTSDSARQIATFGNS